MMLNWIGDKKGFSCYPGKPAGLYDEPDEALAKAFIEGGLYEAVSGADASASRRTRVTSVSEADQSETESDE